MPWESDPHTRLPGIRRLWRERPSVDLETGEFGRQSREALDSPVRRSVFNEDVLTLHVAVFAQSVADRRPRRTNIR